MGKYYYKFNTQNYNKTKDVEVIIKFIKHMR